MKSEHQRSEVLTKDALLNAIDSPTVAALADVFSPRNTQNVLSKSYSEQIADILLPRFAPVAQASGVQPEVFVRRLELVRKFIAREYNDPAQELRGDWIDPRARPAHDALCLCLQELASSLPSADRGTEA